MSDYTYLAVRPAARHSGTLGEGRTSFLLHRIYKSFSFFFFYFTSNEKALGAKVRPSGMKPVCRQAMKLLLWPREIFTTPEGRVSNALSGRTVHIFLLPQLRLPLAGIPSVTLRHSVRTLSSFSSPRSFFFRLLCWLSKRCDSTPTLYITLEPICNSSFRTLYSWIYNRCRCDVWWIVANSGENNVSLYRATLAFKTKSDFVYKNASENRSCITHGIRWKRWLRLWPRLFVGPIMNHDWHHLYLHIAQRRRNKSRTGAHRTP